MWTNRVIWSEGLFLQPHHFQQQERYLESCLDRRLRGLLSYGWGFERLEIDVAALSMGKLQLNAAAGILPDGTPFSFPSIDAPPVALEVRADAKNQLVYLGVPVERPGVASVSLDAQSSSANTARYVASDSETVDSNAGFGDTTTIQVGRLMLRLVCTDERNGRLAAMPVARIAERRSDGQVTLDGAFVPPSLSVNDTGVLNGFLREVIGKLRQRIETAAAGMEHSGRGGVSEIAEFLMLQSHNRYCALLEHLVNVPRLHPERLYALLLELTGDLASFVPERRLEQPFAAYDHDDLQATFRPLMSKLRHLLSYGMEKSAIQIALHDRRFGVRVAVVQDRELLRSAGFVLAVHAQLPTEALRAHFPRQVKIGPIERLKDLVNLALPGIELRALPVAPRQIPFHAGYSYFELDRNGEMWAALERSGGVGMHITGDFPGLELELWAIRS